MGTKLFDLSGKLALLTGSSRGIGKHLACGMAEAGATVIINGVDELTVAATVAEFESAGLKAIGKAFDVTDSDSINAAVADIEANTRPIDILVNNAGIQRRTPLLECDDATCEEVMNTNLASSVRRQWHICRCLTISNAAASLDSSPHSCTLG